MASARPCRRGGQKWGVQLWTHCPLLPPVSRQGADPAGGPRKIFQMLLGKQGAGRKRPWAEPIEGVQGQG